MSNPCGSPQSWPDKPAGVGLGGVGDAEKWLHPSPTSSGELRGREGRNLQRDHHYNHHHFHRNANMKGASSMINSAGNRCTKNLAGRKEREKTEFVWPAVGRTTWQ